MQRERERGEGSKRNGERDRQTRTERGKERKMGGRGWEEGRGRKTRVGKNVKGSERGLAIVLTISVQQQNFASISHT